MEEKEIPEAMSRDELTAELEEAGHDRATLDATDHQLLIADVHAHRGGAIAQPTPEMYQRSRAEAVAELAFPGTEISDEIVDSVSAVIGAFVRYENERSNPNAPVADRDRAHPVKAQIPTLEFADRNELTLDQLAERNAERAARTGAAVAITKPKRSHSRKR